MQHYSKRPVFDYSSIRLGSFVNLGQFKSHQAIDSYQNQKSNGDFELHYPLLFYFISVINF
jgi:hypothetical protein